MVSGLELDKFNNKNQSNMSSKSVGAKITPAKYIKSLGGESMFFRSDYPEWMESKSDLQWVKYMNKKYGFKWTGKDSK